MIRFLLPIRWKKHRNECGNLRGWYRPLRHSLSRIVLCGCWPPWPRSRSKHRDNTGSMMLHAWSSKWTSFFGKLSFTLGSLCGRMVEIHIWIVWVVDELSLELLECACLLRMAAHSSRSQLVATTSQNHVRHTPKHPETHLRIPIYQLYISHICH